MVSFFSGLFSNKLFLSFFFAYLCANILKVAIYYVLLNRVNLRLFVQTGGMPSAHTASVCALSTALYLETGASDLFIVCLLFSIIVIGDAVGYRRAVGQQAEVINRIVEDIAMFRKFKTRRLYELIGHTPRQVLAGALLGILIGVLVHFA